MTMTKTTSFMQAGTRAKSRRGRNPSIDVEKIENAVREIGQQGTEISMKEVADHLGVNVTTLYRRALLQHPDLLDFVQAALDPDFVNLEQEASILVEFGFEPRAALMAHSFLITTITGYVQQELQTIEEARAGYAPYYARLFQNLDSQPERLPTLSAVNLSQKDLDRDLNFKALVSYAIGGIGCQKGAPTDDKKKL